jgi:hypothetical protein
MFASDKVWSRIILEENQIVDRTLRGWITAGKFPPPDGNINGRNFWHLPTYQKWKADVLAGKFAMKRRPCAAVSEADTAASSAPPAAA